MVPDLDVWRAAALLIKQHGKNAEIAAAQRADELLDRGDIEGQRVWLRIRRAVADLQAEPSGPVHLVLHDLLAAWMTSATHPRWMTTAIR